MHIDAMNPRSVGWSWRLHVSNSCCIRQRRLLPRTNIRFRNKSNLSRPSRSLRRLGIVCTSEHWWEDEEEFDALTDALDRKLIILVTPKKCGETIENLRRLMKDIDVTAIFSSSDAAEYADRLWSGFDGPPLFRKIRMRSTIDENASKDEIRSFLEELLQQNWRLDLDAGLGSHTRNVDVVLLVSRADMAKELLSMCSSQTESPRMGGLVAEFDHSKVGLMSIAPTIPGESRDWRSLIKSVEVLNNIEQLKHAVKSSMLCYDR